MCGWQPITAPTSNFLHVNAQMCNLTKQKTASSCKTLCVIYEDIEINNSDFDISSTVLTDAEANLPF
jgi:hypothetical protein